MRMDSAANQIDAAGPTRATEVKCRNGRTVLAIAALARRFERGRIISSLRLARNADLRRRWHGLSSLQLVDSRRLSAIGRDGEIASEEKGRSTDGANNAHEGHFRGDSSWIHSPPRIQWNVNCFEKCKPPLGSVLQSKIG